MTHFVRKPTPTQDGAWMVVISETRSPLSKVIEAVRCTSEAGAFQTYRRIKKQKGEWL